MKISTVLRGVLLCTPFMLTACGGSGNLMRDFGLVRDTPDEFTVTTRAPLSMPPDLTLRPPQPGAPRPQEQSTTQTAEVTVAGPAALAAPASRSDSPGQDALIAAAGPPPPANIRAEVDAEAAKAASDQSLSDELMFWKPPAPVGTAVDAEKEADRLRANAALGKSPDAGNTPVIEPKPRNFFDWLF